MGVQLTSRDQPLFILLLDPRSLCGIRSLILSQTLWTADGIESERIVTIKTPLLRAALASLYWPVYAAGGRNICSVQRPAGAFPPLFRLYTISPQAFRDSENSRANITLHR